jgi:hypothetical protein
VANERSNFYRRVLEQLLDEGVLRRELTVLVSPAARPTATSSTSSASST